ncbi:hypothetical protein MPSI1_000380 [Malassezia psittaci]|uniref:Uncharacterized protein n=1 Tax=Malassezia psittaci TaxID=1821823 RepID=A0AAF0JCX4_9BASI|nr:hypothetical protein MPSI1_000380 [Malassezia psittaci]
MSDPQMTTEENLEGNAGSNIPSNPGTPTSQMSFSKEIPSPFSDAMGPYKLKKEDFQWHQVQPDLYLRGLWGGELYQERRSHCTERLSLARMRFDFPVLAVRIELGHLAIPFLPALVYDKCDYQGVEAWLDQAIVVHRPSTQAEKQQSMKQRTEAIRKKLTLEPIDPSRCAKVSHVVLGNNTNELAVLVYCAHAISDAHTEMMVMQKQLEFIGKIADAPNPLPATHDLHPSSLSWGEEVSRLPPCLHELYGVDIEAFEPEKGVRTSGKIMRGHALRLDEGREHGKGLCTTYHTNLTLSEEESKSIYRAAKSQGWTVTLAVDAARHMAYVEMRRRYLEKKHQTPIPETLHTNFLMPMDGRGYFVEPYKNHDFAGNATSGFVTIMPLRDPYFKRAEDEQRLYFWRGIRDLNQTRVFCKIAANLAKQYKEASTELVDVVEGITPLLMMGNLFSPEYPPNDLAPEGFSSVGVVERLLKTEHKLHGYSDPLQVTDWFVGLTMSRHIFSLQFSMHLWSFKGQIHLSVIHTDHFSKDYVTKFLEVIKSSCLLFAEAYDPLKPPLPTGWDRCVVM